MATKLTQSEAVELLQQYARDLITMELAELQDIIKNGSIRCDPEDPTFQTFIRRPLSVEELKDYEHDVASWQKEMGKISELSYDELLDYLESTDDVMSLGEILSDALVAK